MVHMNMHGNDWQGRHRSAATFLASIMMRGKIIWWMVGSIPPFLNDCMHEPEPIPLPPRSRRGECARPRPRPAAAAVHETGQKKRSAARQWVVAGEGNAQD